MSVPAEQLGLDGPTDETIPPEPEYRYSDPELVTILDQIIDTSTTGTGGEVDAQRRDAYEYYYGLRPYAANSNTSDYVSMEVFDGIESMKAKLIKAFASNRNLVRFSPTSEHDVETQDLKTKLVMRIINGRDGQGYRLLHDVFHDGLISKLACVKRYYRERKVPVIKEFTDVPSEQLQAAAMNEDVQIIEVESERYQDQIVMTPRGPMSYRAKLASGRVQVIEDRSGIELEVIPPENVHIPGSVQDLSQPNELPGLVIEYTRRPYQLIEEGFDPAVVAKLSTNPRHLETIDSIRDQIDGTESVPSIDAIVDIPIEEGFLYLDMDSEGDGPDGPASLWHIIKSDNTVLLKERVSEIPLRFWTPFRISHKAIGLSLADVFMDLQASTSSLGRGVLDNVHRVNAGVRIFNMSMIRNPRDVIDNPIGGIIDTDQDPNRVGAVAPQPAVSPATMGMMELLSQQKEMRTGDTRLGRGLSVQNVLTHQNSADMIAQLIEVGSDRPMMLARGFAELFWRPLMLDIYHLAVENDVTVQLDVDGKLTPVKARQLPPSDEMIVDVALTPDYGDQHARKVLTAHQLMSQDPMLAPLYSMEERYALMSEVFHLLGMPNFLGNPTDPKVQQRLELAQQKQQKMEQMQQMMMARQLHLQEREVQAKERKVAGDQRLEKERVDLDAVQGAAEQNLDEREFQWQRAVDIAELRVEREQKRAAKLGVE